MEDEEEYYVSGRFEDLRKDIESLPDDVPFEEAIKQRDDTNRSGHPSCDNCGQSLEDVELLCSDCQTDSD